MRALATLGLTLAVFFAACNALSITQAGLSGSMGEDEETPIMEGDDFTLECGISMNADDSWILCSWSHIVEEEYDNNDEELMVMCSASDQNQDNDKTCSNQGGSEELSSGYASRIHMNVASSYCGLTVRDANPWDNGRWDCHVTDNTLVQKFASVDVFVSNQSTIRITEPDLYDDDSQTIVYELYDTHREIEATCTAYGGIPAPTFKWYVNDDSGDELDIDPDSNIREGTDPIWGDYIQQTISWEPTIDQLCNDYDLREAICDDNIRKNRYFNFDLICKVDQGEYYQRENEGETAVVTVEVNSARSILASMALMASSAFLATIVAI